MEAQAAFSSMLDYAQGFKAMFAKEDFNVLLEYHHWNYTIELISRLEPRSSKVYPLSSIEQKEVDIFFKENLYTGQIQSFKFSMTALVFFIKKKNGSLHLVWNYWSLNSMTIKNKYPLFLISKLISQLCRTKYFIKLNICWSLNNVYIKSKDE